MLFNIPDSLIVFLFIGHLPFFFVIGMVSIFQYYHALKKDFCREYKHYLLLQFKFCATGFISAISFGLLAFMDGGEINGFVKVTMFLSAFFVGTLFYIARGMRKLALEKANKYAE